MKNTMKKTIAFGLTVAMLATSGILSFAEQVDEVVMLTEATETIEIQEEQVTPVPEVAEEPVIPDAEEQVPATEEPAAPEAEAPVTPEETPAVPEETPVVTEPEQVTEPEPIPQLEPVAEPEKVTEPEPEKVIEAEPIIEPEKVVETEPVIEPENVIEPEQTAESEKVAEAEQVTEPEQVAEPEQTVEPEAEKEEQTEETEQPADPTENMDKCCLILRAGEEFANLYTDPDLNSPVICQIPANEYVYMMGYDIQWSNVYYKDQMGYIENEKLAMYNPRPKEEEAEDIPTEDTIEDNINEETPIEEDITTEVNEPDSEIAEVIDESYEADSEVMTEEETQITTGNEESIITEITEEEQTTVGNEETGNSETEEITEETGEETENIEDYEFRKMHLKSNIDGQKNFYVGQVVNMYAELEGFEGLDYTIQWQCSKDRVNMEDIPGATGPTYSFVMDETTFYYIWTYRVILDNAE